MKTKKLISLVLISLLAVMTGCMIDSSITGLDGDHNNNNTPKIYGSGKTISLIKDFKDFNTLDLNSGFTVNVIRGDKYFVSIEVDDNIAGYVTSYQSGGKVYISLKSGYSYSNVTLKIVVETPDLETIKANGGVALEFTGNENYDNLLLELNGGSVVNLSGTSKNLEISGNGGAVLNLFNFPADTCNLYFNGGCIAYLNVTSLLNASLSGGSIVKYKGNPTIGNISISGGSIIQRDN